VPSLVDNVNSIILSVFTCLISKINARSTNFLNLEQKGSGRPISGFLDEKNIACGRIIARIFFFSPDFLTTIKN